MYGYVYFVRDGDAVKIGWTSNYWPQRIADLQSGNPRQLEVLLVLYTEERSEELFHRFFRQSKVKREGRGHRGEWFTWSKKMEKTLREFEVDNII